MSVAGQLGRQPRSHLPRNVTTVVAVIVWIGLVLTLDHIATVDQQRWLGVGTWLLLVGLLSREANRIRAQVAVVVAFATLVEYTFSYELHVYVYRFHNVPWFVPPGHGLVYLGALAIGRSRVVVTNARVLVPITLVAGASYAAWGLILSSRHDVLGVFWFGCLVFFLIRGRQPMVFVGAFVVVTYLELLGTHLGSWTWQARDPIAHVVRMGNPPSGAAGGYGFFDAAALALAPTIESWLAGRRGGGRVNGDSSSQRDQDVVVQQTVAAHH